MLVLKFGGTSVAAAEPIVRAAAIVGGAQGRRVVVVSALAGVTDRLLQTAGFAAAIAAAEELLSSRLIAAAFNSFGVRTACVDARAEFVTDDHHGEAAPDLAETAKRVALRVTPLLDDADVGDAMQRIYEQLVAQPPTRMEGQTTAAAGRDVRVAFAATGAQPS